MKWIASLSACLALIAGSVLSGLARAKEPARPPRPVVQLALSLETSTGMDGLIGQAKPELWNVVNGFVRARQHGRRPAVQVALFEYGKSTLPSDQGYGRQILALSEDLDRV